MAKKKIEPKKVLKGSKIVKKYKEEDLLAQKLYEQIVEEKVEDQIKSHGRPVSYNSIKKSKKVYDRKCNKAEFKKALPYLFFGLLNIKIIA